MERNLVKIKNKETGLFWYGFSKGEKQGWEHALSNGDDEPDCAEENCTHYDLNLENEYNYVMSNFVMGEHQMITI